jgi:hypothetical protein
VGGGRRAAPREWPAGGARRAPHVARRARAAGRWGARGLRQRPRQANPGGGGAGPPPVRHWGRQGAGQRARAARRRASSAAARTLGQVLRAAHGDPGVVGRGRGGGLAQRHLLDACVSVGRGAGPVRLRGGRGRGPPTARHTHRPPHLAPPRWRGPRGRDPGGPSGPCRRGGGRAGRPPARAGRAQQPLPCCRAGPHPGPAAACWRGPLLRVWRVWGGVCGLEGWERWVAR